jgi:protoporphyrinogen oxidase
MKNALSNHFRSGISWSFPERYFKRVSPLSDVKNMPGHKTAVIIGAGPAGLTAAYELLNRTSIRPIVLEATGDIGGISKTVNYKGNRIDIGGHRFFSKSKRVMTWWQNIMPVEGSPATNSDDCLDPNTSDCVLLIRNRLSRILFLRKFFDYPLSLSLNTFRNLGLARLVRATLSYAKACIHPRKEVKSLEDFFINRFGNELYLTFFRDYTEKVWGVPCSRIKPEWGSQRVKGLSIAKVVVHAIKRTILPDRSVDQNHTETTLIEQFLYPKYGPGQMWEAVAQKIIEKGGEIHLQHRVSGIKVRNGKITEIEIWPPLNDRTDNTSPDYVFCTMPVKDLIECIDGSVPQNVREIAQGLVYRDFITVGLLLSRFASPASEVGKNNGESLRDNWIYIQEPDVKVGRLQIFNNWSPYMVSDPDATWVGLEYFCNEGDGLWNFPDNEMAEFAVDELVTIGLIDKSSVLDHTVIRVPKTYPAYFGTYENFDKIRNFTDQIENLFLIGRNGMHRYNNQDHSMLTAMAAVDNIIAGVNTKDNIWAVNTEQEYHETR